MYSSEYVAYKHIVESEKQNVKSTPLPNLSNLREPPRYLYPIKQKKIIDCNLELNQASYTDDFILLSEFSEIEGPKPLFTIPLDGGCNFNKNDYSLHVMCVDFHTTQQQNLSNTLTSSCSAQKASLSTTSRFSLTKDTSIINYWDLNSNGIAAYVHHFTLYDIEARGFVRPFCLAYLTYEREKVQMYFNNFVQTFTKITNLFKKSNLNLFKRHLDEHMKNLYYTREKYMLWTNLVKTPFHNDSERVDLLKKYDIDNRADNKFQKFNLITLNNLINEIETVLDLIKSELEANNWYENDKPTNEMINKLLNRNCESNDENRRVKTVGDESRSYSAQTNGGVSSQMIDVNINKPKLILDLHGSISYSFNFNLNNSAKNMLQNKVMKNIYQLAPTTARVAFKKLRLAHKFYSKSTYLLKFSDLESKFRSNNNKLWQFTLGNCLINDQSYKIEIIELYKCLLRRNTSIDELRYYSINDLEVNNVGIKPEYYDETIRRESPFYTPLDQTLATIDDDDDDDYTSILSDGELNNSTSVIDRDYDFVNSIVLNGKTSLQQSSNLKQINEKLIEINEFDFDSILRTFLYKKFPNSFVHIIYTLLKGRPLVVITRYKQLNYDKLQMLINCLFNFIPNTYYSSTNQIIMINDNKPVKLVDLKAYKIIGLTLNNQSDDDMLLLKYIPITIRNYVSILDLDKFKFTGPKYNGTYLVTLCHKLKYLQNDSIFYLNFLKQFTYFYLNFLFILQNSANFNRDSTTVDNYLEFSRKVFSHSTYVPQIDASDMNIVAYLIKSFRLRQLFLCQTTTSQIEVPLNVEYELLTNFQC
jgi:hypothetical protein